MLEDSSYRWSRETLTTLTRSARTAGRGAVTSGRWLVDTVIEMARTCRSGTRRRCPGTTAA